MHVVVLLSVTGPVGRYGRAILIALELAVLLLLDVAVEVLDKQVFTQFLIACRGILASVERVLGEQTDSGVTIIDGRGNQQAERKIFNDNEGEYVEFEEIK